MYTPPAHSVCAPHAREGEESAAIRHRRYGGPQDFHRISDLLTRHYRPGNRDGNWFQAEWEYAYTHPCFEELAIGKIGLWEEDGELVAAVTYESRLGEAFFHTQPQRV